jgi:long-chain acyl-CoA synthetase
VNVYPLEVESALREVAGVDDVAVFGAPDPEWGQRVCAAVVGTVSTDDLASHARTVLAPAKRPKDYLVVPELPMTATGKVRRDVLPELLAGT